MVGTSNLDSCISRNREELKDFSYLLRIVTSEASSDAAD
ncbi:Uncharacterised protein [Vibrio cholerae]|nr:Uncharacterised protein [Vibrio cholerae]